MENLAKRIRETEISMAVVATMTRLGAISGELTYAEAYRLYGRWFANAAKDGKILPSRIGATGKPRWYSISDILATKAAELEKVLVVSGKK
ncbi:MAG: hypothetical protein MJY76_00750 [Bacteroidales bacterium]|nr:hypothetical protein [Bacteroidales bacterium]